MPEEKFDIKEFEATIESQNKALDKIQKSIEGKVDQKALDTITASLDTVKDNLAALEMVGEVKLTEYVTKLQTQADKLETELTDLKQRKGLNEKSFDEKLNELVTNAEFKKCLKNREQKEFELDTKAALASSTAFTRADTSTTTLLQLNIPGVTKSPWMKTPLYAAVNKRVVGEAVGSIRYTEEVTKTNSAAFKAEGVTLPQSEAGWIARTENFYKLGHYVTFPEEMIEDSDYVQDELNDLITNGLLQVVNKKMWLGAGSGSDEILGIINTTSQIAKNFAKPWNLDAAIANPNAWDVIMCAALQVNNGVDTDGTGDLEGYNATVVFVNPGTMTFLKTGEKDAMNRALWKDYMTPEGIFDGMTIVGDRRIPKGKFVVGDTMMSTAFIKRNLTIKTSENVASQFLADQVSIKATMRLAFLTKILQRYAWVYGDFETAKGLISAA